MGKIGDAEPIAQSGAMLRYVGQLGGLYPAADLLKIEEIIGLEEDVGKAIAPSVYTGMRPQNYGYPADMPKEDRSAIQMRLRETMVAPDGELRKFLGFFERALWDSKFMCGDNVTIADCQVIPFLRKLKKGILDGIPTTIVEDYPQLNAYHDRFHDLPQVKAYYDKLATMQGA